MPEDDKLVAVKFKSVFLDHNYLDLTNQPHSIYWDGLQHLVIRDCHIVSDGDTITVTSCPGCEFHEGRGDNAIELV